MPILARAGAAAAKGFGMLGKIAAAVDEYFEYVTLLLHGNGTNGAQNNTFLDSSTNNFTITRNGNTTQGTFTPYGSNWGNYFPPTANNCLRFGTSTNLALGSGDFTVEFWAFVNALAPSGYSVFADWRTNGNFGNTIPVIADLNNNGKLAFAVGTGSSFTTIIESSSLIPLNSWTHVAIVRSGTTVTMYFNGSSVGSGTSSVNFGIETFSISNPQAGNYNPNAYFSNFRIVKGTAVYTAAFTPPTTPLTAITNTQLLTCQSNRFIDNSSNAFAITVNGSPSVQRFSPFNPTTPYAAGTIGGSGYFDGSGDYLTAADNAALELGSGDWTLECWYYQNVTNTYSALIGKSGTSAQFASYLLQINSLTPTFYLSTSGSSYAVTISSSINITNSNWTHLAVVRNGNTITLYVNGASGGTAAYSSTPYDGSYSFAVGSYGDGSFPINGYVANARLVKGTAVYTATFTPPTAPLSAITNTSLLLNFTNGGIIDNAMMNDLETVGNAQISTSVSKFGGGSLAFDGTGDWLLAPSSPNFAFLTGDFTVEMWAYFNNTTNTVFFDMRGVGGGSLNNPCFFWSATASTVQAYLNNDYRITSGTLSTGQWYHIALVRSGTTATMYINGVSAGTYTYSTSVAQQALYVGTGYGLAGWNGYIDDLRITKGYARYTANFTAPTAPFPDQ